MPVGDPPASATPTAARPRNNVQKPVAALHKAVAALQAASAPVIMRWRLKRSTAKPNGIAATANGTPYANPAKQAPLKLFDFTAIDV